MSEDEGIYRLILGTLQVVTASGRAGAAPAPRAQPLRSLQNHSRARQRRGGNPKLLGHDGFPAGLTNGRKLELPTR
jgi:hypothetical protein